jgi:hypothetical protein
MDDIGLELRDPLSQSFVRSARPKEAWHREDLAERSGIFQIGRGSLELIHNVATVAQHLRIECDYRIFPTPARSVFVVDLENAHLSIDCEHDVQAAAASFDRSVIIAD